jgi:hypothetical protein
VKMCSMDEYDEACEIHRVALEVLRSLLSDLVLSKRLLLLCRSAAFSASNSASRSGADQHQSSLLVEVAVVDD